MSDLLDESCFTLVLWALGHVLSWCLSIIETAVVIRFCTFGSGIPVQGIATQRSSLVTCVSRCEQISSSNTLSEAPSNLITMAWCSLQALSTPDTSKTISTYLDCKDVLAARRTCHLMEPLPRCLPNLLPGQRCPCFWRSPEWLCTLINKSTKVPRTVLRWPIARACDNLVGPIYPPHKWSFDTALRRRREYGLLPVHDTLSTDQHQSQTSSDLTDSRWPSTHSEHEDYPSFHEDDWADEIRTGIRVVFRYR